MSTTVIPMSVETTAIGGLLKITVKAVTDERGTVREFFRRSGFAEQAVPVPEHWAQVNVTWTRPGGVRGLHGEAADKLIGIAAGEAFGAYLDARPASDTYGTVVTLPLVEGVQMFVPAGVCNGFQATSDGGCQYLYCFGTEWTPGMAGIAVSPLDPALGIAWPLAPDPTDPGQVSAKDAAAPLFADLAQ